MKPRWVLVTIILILVISSGAFLFLKKNNQSSSPSTAPIQSQNNNQPTSAPTQTSAEEKSMDIVEVMLTQQGYSPKNMTIAKGTKVVFLNQSGENATVDSDPHPFHTIYPPLNLGNFSNGEKLELVFNETGTYNYHNHLNPSDKGTIIVK